MKVDSQWMDIAQKNLNQNFHGQRRIYHKDITLGKQANHCPRE